MLPFHVLCGRCCDSLCLPQTPSSLFPHNSSHNLLRVKHTSLHSFPIDSCEELVVFSFCWRYNIPQNRQNLLSSFPAEPYSSLTQFNHPLLWHSHILPHSSVRAPTYWCWRSASNSPSCDTIFQYFWVNFVIQHSWYCLAGEESSLFQQCSCSLPALCLIQIVNVPSLQVFKVRLDEALGGLT